MERPRGAAFYEQYNCLSCHEEGENPKLLDGLAGRLGYQAVIEVLQAPQSPMPVFYSVKQSSGNWQCICSSRAPMMNDNKQTRLED